MLSVENIRPGVNPDCGCYEEECLIWPFECVMHLEPYGTGDVFFDTGDCDFEENFPANTIEELRQQAVNFVENLYSQGRIE